MTPELMLIGGGVILLILAALGGGIEVKELKVPQINPISRFFCAISGVCLVFFGMYVTNPNTSPIKPHPLPLRKLTIKVNNVYFTISDALNEKFNAEQIEVFIDGNSVGILKLDKLLPFSILKIPVPSEGKYQYRLAGRIIKETSSGSKEYTISGKGYIQVVNGIMFIMQGKKLNPSHIVISLIPEQ